MGYGVGQTTGQTGVGTTANTTGQTQQAGYGGKGGGQATQPQPTQLAQPSQSSTAQSAPQPVFGGNALGYNMSRLAQRMDPSATLPQPRQASTAQPAPATPTAPTGGKGGGYTDIAQIPEVKDFFDFLQQQQTTQPTEQQESEPETPAGPYGVTGGGPTTPAPTPSYEPEEIENPFATQLEDYRRQMQEMQAAYQAQLDALKEQTAGMKDTGAEIYDLGPGYEELSNPTTTAEEKAKTETAAGQEQLVKDIYTPGVRGTDINQYFGNVLNMDRGIDVDKKGDIIVRDPTNPKSKATFKIPKGSTVDKDGNIISPTGQKVSIPSRYLSSAADKAKYSAGIQFGDTLDEIQREYGAAKINTTGAKIDKKGMVILKNGTKIPSGSYIDKDGVLRSPSGAKIAIKAKDLASYVAPAKTTKKKAHGGVIHNGMSNRLKQMLGED